MSKAVVIKNNTDINELSVNDFARSVNQSRYTPPSEWFKFVDEHKGMEFFNKYNKRSIPLWLIHNTFDNTQIRDIMYDQDAKYGYRIKDTEEENN